METHKKIVAYNVLAFRFELAGLALKQVLALHDALASVSALTLTSGNVAPPAVATSEPPSPPDGATYNWTAGSSRHPGATVGIRGLILLEK